MTIPTNSFNSHVTGQLAVSITIMALISIITLAIFYAGIPIFGPINDIITAVGGLLCALLAWRFHPILHKQVPGISALLLLLAWGGSAAIIINSVLVAFGRMHWMTGGMYTAIGYGLLGIWLIALHRVIGAQPFLSPGIMRFGTFAAIAMLFGLAAGPLLASGVTFTKNLLVSLSYLGAATGWLLFPIWCWLVGRGLLSSWPQ